MEMYVVSHGGQNLAFHAETNRYSLTTGGSLWEMVKNPSLLLYDGKEYTAEFPAPAEVKVVDDPTATGIAAVYRGFAGSDVQVFTRAEIEKTTGDILFTVRVEKDKFGEVLDVNFPAPWHFDTQDPADYTVLSRMQGALFPAGTPIKLANGLLNERDGYMPIYGQKRGESGYLAIFETSYDARYWADGGDIQPRFTMSLGHIGYPRKMRYLFRQNFDYNMMAKLYRSYVQKRGRLVTLAEKEIRNPAVKRLYGCPIIHANVAIHICSDSIYYTPDAPEKNDFWVDFDTNAAYLRALKEKGLKKGYTHFDGWGSHGYDNLHPSPLPPHEAAGGTAGMRRLSEAAHECGIIFGIHDQYRDYYFDAPGYTDEHALMNGDGSHPSWGVWYGGKQTVLCATKALEYVRRNYDWFAENGIDVEAAYLDVFSVVEMDECFNPDHPMTREQCARYRRECLDEMTFRGIIPSSEEVLDCILPSQVLCHHAPFYTDPLGDPNADPVGIPIPLLNLVYHDCVVIPWFGGVGDRGGWGIPKNDNGWTHAALNAGPVYLNIDADAEEIALVEERCAIAERLTHAEMLRHEFLSADYRRQRTVWSDGTVIEVDFETDEFTVKYGDA